MKEFNSTIRVTLFHDTETSPFTLHADHFDFEPVSGNDAGGQYWDCSRDFIVDRPSDYIRWLLRYARIGSVSISDSQGNVYTIGSIELPARIHLSAHLDKCRLHVSCKMLVNPLL